MNKLKHEYQHTKNKIFYMNREGHTPSISSLVIRSIVRYVQKKSSRGILVILSFKGPHLAVSSMVVITQVNSACLQGKQIITKDYTASKSLAWKIEARMISLMFVVYYFFKYYIPVYIYISIIMILVQKLRMKSYDVDMP